jgi:hypothetical protein
MENSARKPPQSDMARAAALPLKSADSIQRAARMDAE